MAENPIAKLPLAAQLGVSLVLALVIGGGFYFGWLKGAWEQERTKKAELQTLQQQIRALEATANKLPEFQLQVQALEQKLEQLKRILPPEKEMPDLMRRLQYLAAQSSLGISKFNPAPPVQKEFYQEVPIALALAGTYHNLGAFLDRISRMSRLVNIGDIKVKASPKQTLISTITVTATATTYVYKDAAPPAGGPRPRPGAAK